MKPAYDNEAFEQYLFNRMDGAERTAFEAALAADPALAKQFARFRQEQQAMELLLEDRLRAKLQQWWPQDQQPASSARRWLLIALLVLGLAGLGWWLLSSKKTGPAPEPSLPTSPATAPVATVPADSTVPSPDPKLQERRKHRAIAADFREPIRYPRLALRSEGDTLSDFEKAVDDLEAGRYASAFAFLKSLQPGDSHFEDAQYVLGLAYFERGSFSKAIYFLQNTASDSTYLYAEKAAWLLALGYLENGQIAACKAAVQQIATDGGNAYQGKARQLLMRLQAEE